VASSWSGTGSSAPTSPRRSPIYGLTIQINTTNPFRVWVSEFPPLVVLAIGGGLTAWDLGFDLGAFDTIDHRRFWAIWILCTIALAASHLFRDAELESIGLWRFVFIVPTLWLLADFLLTDDNFDDPLQIGLEVL